MEVLEEKRAVRTSTLGLVGMRHGHAIARGVQSLLGSGVAVVFVGSKDTRFRVAIGLALATLLCRHDCS